MTETKWYSRPGYVLVSLALVLGFSLMPATTSMVSAQGATGSFTTGNPPTVTIVYDPGSVTPVTEMDVPVNVTNGDRNLSELSNMTFKFWYDANGGAASESDFNALSPTTQDGISINWTPGSFGGLVANATSYGSASWVKLTCTQPADLDVTNGIFWFNFTIGKAARKTLGGDCWQIAAVVNSTTYGKGFGSDAEGVTMSYYSEVTISPAATVDWGLVAPGLAFADDGDSEESLGANVIYIVNSNYTENVSSSANWTNTTASNATLDASGACGSPQQFSLKANVSGTLPGGNLVDVSPGVTIDTGAITGDGTADGGSGNNETANTLWLKLASSFETATYNGTITYSAPSA